MKDTICSFICLSSKEDKACTEEDASHIQSDHQHCHCHLWFVTCRPFLCSTTQTTPSSTSFVYCKWWLHSSVGSFIPLSKVYLNGNVKFNKTHVSSPPASHKERSITASDNPAAVNIPPGDGANDKICDLRHTSAAVALAVKECTRNWNVMSRRRRSFRYVFLGLDHCCEKACIFSCPIHLPELPQWWWGDWNLILH